MGDKTHRSWHRRWLLAAAITGAVLLSFRVNHSPNGEPRDPSFASRKSGPLSAPGMVRENSPAQALAFHAPSPPALVADGGLAIFTRFDAWFIALRRGESPSTVEGLRLARERRAALKVLITSDPREALARALPRSLRAELPPEIRAELETPIDAFARYEVGATDRTQAFTAGPKSTAVATPPTCLAAGSRR